MCEAVGHRVTALERVAFGPLGLRGLGLGESRRLSRREVDRLRRAAEPKPPVRGGRGAGRKARRSGRATA
jgi:23S rRNA pseudouridine2605 synthase